MENAAAAVTVLPAARAVRRNNNMEGKWTP